MGRGAKILLGVSLVVASSLWIGACRGEARVSTDRATQDGVRWERDLGAALNRAGSERKLVMVDFYTDWCGWCKYLDETTYADPDVQKALRGLVAVKLNAEREGRREAARYRVQSYPMILFLDSTGTVVGRIPGYLPPRPFLEELRDIVRRG